MLLTNIISHARRQPGKVAWRFHPGGTGHTFAQVHEGACAAAGKLVAAGVAPGTVVLIFAPLSAQGMELFLGAMLMGAVPAFMPLPSDRQDPQHYWASHAKLFRHIRDGAIFLPAALLPTLEAACPGNPLLVASLEGLAQTEAAPLAAPAARAGSQVALLQHSSGTTDLKKGVQLSFDQIEAQIGSYARALGLDGADRIVSWLPLYHDMGLIACFVLPLSLGLEATYLDPFRWVARPQSLFDAIQAYRGTHVWLPNFAFNHMARTVPALRRTWDLASVKAFVSCSEPCKAASFDAFVSAFESSGVRQAQLTCCYAMAETVFAITQTPPGRPAQRLRIDPARANEVGAFVVAGGGSAEAGQDALSCGPAIPGIEVRVVGAAGEPLPEGHCGEIQVRGDFVFAGYNKDPERTANAFDGEWFRTRDLGFAWQGELYVGGRMDDLIILSGRNFYAHHIEAAVSAIDGILPGRAVAFGVFNAEVGSQVLVVVAETTADLADADGAGDLATSLSQSIFENFGLVPSDVVLVPPKTVIKTTSGKVDRQTNRRRYVAGELREWQ